MTFSAYVSVAPRLLDRSIVVILTYSRMHPETRKRVNFVDLRTESLPGVFLCVDVDIKRIIAFEYTINLLYDGLPNTLVHRSVPPVIEHLYVDGIVETWFRTSIEPGELVAHARACVAAYGKTIFELLQFSDDFNPEMSLNEGLRQIEQVVAFLKEEGACWTRIYVRSGNLHVEAWIAFYLNRPAYPNLIDWVADSYEYGKQLLRDLHTATRIAPKGELQNPGSIAPTD